MLFLVLALGMLIAGETVIKDRLPPTLFLVYWLGCFAFTMLAIITAFRDVRALQAKAIKEQRGLLDSTLRDIEIDARQKLGRDGANGKEPGTNKPDSQRKHPGADPQTPTKTEKSKDKRRMG